MQQALPPIWLLTDRDTGNPSYIQYHEDDGVCTVGPFMYTSEQNARRAMESRSFLARKAEVQAGPDPNLAVAEIEGMGIVKGILTRFDPSGTDVFALDEGLMPLTPSGAIWVDAATGKDVWSPMFADRSPGQARWLSAILKQVSDLLGVEMIRVNLDKEEFIRAKANAARQKVEEHVTISVEPEGPAMYGEVPLSTLFRVKTSGLEQLDRPELEMTGVQPLFVGEAMALIAGWAAYSLDHPMAPGQSLMGQVDPLNVILRVVQAGRGRFRLEQVLYTNPAHSASGMVH